MVDVDDAIEFSWSIERRVHRYCVPAFCKVERGPSERIAVFRIADGLDISLTLATCDTNLWRRVAIILSLLPRNV